MPMVGVLLLVGVPLVSFIVGMAKDIGKIIYICVHWRDYK